MTTSTPKKPKKTRRKTRRYRDSPEERPKVSLSRRFRNEVAKLVGDRLLATIFAAFPDGCLPGTPAEFHSLEDALLAAAQSAVAGEVLAAVVQAVHQDKGFLLWCMAAAARREGLVPGNDRLVRVRLVGGAEASVLTPGMGPRPNPGRPAPGKRGKGGAGLLPVLAALGVVARCSPWLACTTARHSAQLASFAESASALEDTGLRLHPDTVRTITQHVADAGLADRERGGPIDNTFAGKRVAVTLDGGRLRCRYEKTGRRRESGRHGYSTPWKEPKLAAAYVFDANGKLDKTCKPVYEGTLAPWKTAIEIFADTLRRHGIAAAESVTIVADGSNNIWRHADELVERLGVDPSRVTFVLDFYHALEHVHDAAKLSSLFENDKTEAGRLQWVSRQESRLKRGDLEKVLDDLASLPTESTAKAGDLAKEIAYLRTRQDKLRYDEFAAAGIPIASGAIESAIRRIVNLRIKGPGVFWKPENAERLLYLRCRLKAGRWTEVRAALHRAALLTARSQTPKILEQVSG